MKYKSLNDFVLTYYLILYIIPSDFDIFLDIYPIWGFQESFSSTITPKNFTFVTLVNGLLLTEIFKSISSPLDPLKSIKLDLSTFKDSRFACNHIEILANSAFNVSYITERFLFLTNILVSSANMTVNKISETKARSWHWWEIIMGPVSILAEPHSLLI